MSVTKKIIRKIQKSHMAMASAPAAIWPKPNIAAMIAMIKNITAQ